MTYPVILGIMYGVFRVGRDERWGVFEWLRLGTLATLTGLIVSVQVKLIMLGLVTDPVTLGASLLSLIGMGALVGLYLWEKWLPRAPQPSMSYSGADAPDGQ